MYRKISSINFNTLNDQQLTDLLYKGLEDDNKNGDFIFVPGSSKAVDYRLPKAIDLYKQGRANKILFSGGVTWGNSTSTEAELLKAKALQQGIPENDILIETHSLHTKENVLASLLILDRALSLHKIKRGIVVTAPYHMRRMYLSLKTYMPSWLEFSLVVANDNTTKRDNWFLNPYGRQRVETEAAKLISYAKKGIILDGEVEISEDL
ncbi:YdcF family protein [Sutcliffiella rhizosphaerae]|uniref:DUF218 domain-containing protein n=1 Tax=Sutcliffiella rhizosphaerae TaxID=2880967 RepID=A0ABN8AE16_9BACI|nr:YdcF family protein [Sutcliffiella rhizosphaerae]CAG9623518.1 hypothetical protein BACCIP111883_04334 [Sutcliffiella rhizosphaerae]